MPKIMTQAERKAARRKRLEYQKRWNKQHPDTRTHAIKRVGRATKAQRTDPARKGNGKKKTWVSLKGLTPSQKRQRLREQQRAWRRRNAEYVQEQREQFERDHPDYQAQRWALTKARILADPKLGVRLKAIARKQQRAYSQRFRKAHGVSRQALEQRALKAKGICLHCRKRKSTPNYITCSPCRKISNEKAQAIREAKKAKGICTSTSCKRPALPGIAQCRKHRKQAQTSSTAWHKRHPDYYKNYNQKHSAKRVKQLTSTVRRLASADAAKLPTRYIE